MSRLNGKVAVVTGASKGIGAGIARSFAEAGASVVVNYASSREGAERVVSQIKAAGGKAIAVKGDVSKAADVKRLFSETKEAFGTIDILLNNAALYYDIDNNNNDYEYLQKVFAVNLHGSWLMAKAVSPTMVLSAMYQARLPLPRRIE